MQKDKRQKNTLFMTITCNFVNLIVSAEYRFDKKKRGCNLVHFTRANLEGIREPSLASPTQRWVLKLKVTGSQDACIWVFSHLLKPVRFKARAKIHKHSSDWIIQRISRVLYARFCHSVFVTINVSIIIQAGLFRSLSLLLYVFTESINVNLGTYQRLICLHWLLVKAVFS